MKLVVESLEELFELELPGKSIEDIINSKEFKENPNTFLIHAARHSFSQGVETALLHGADININNGYPLMVSSENGDYELVELLLDKGADINTSQGFPLKIAAYEGHDEVVKLLLDRGADVKYMHVEDYKNIQDAGNSRINKIIRDFRASN